MLVPEVPCNAEGNQGALSPALTLNPNPNLTLSLSPSPSPHPNPTSNPNSNPNPNQVRPEDSVPDADPGGSAAAFTLNDDTVRR